jgi:integrase
MNFIKRLTINKQRIFYYYDFGRGAGQRPSTGIFTYAKPKNAVEKNHNREALALLEVKKSQLILEKQSIGSGYIPSHRFKANFLDYYSDYVKQNRRRGNRHLQNSETHFRSFLRTDFIAPSAITENLCLRFRQWLLDRYNGDTPANFYSRFKRVITAATKDHYFHTNPVEGIAAKSNAKTHFKEHLEADEYIALLATPCLNPEVQEAFIFCCYTGLRFVDIKRLAWTDIKGMQLRTKIVQQKTGLLVELTLHPIAKRILEKRQKLQGTITEKVFPRLPNNDGCNKVLDQWVQSAHIKKSITWSCARLSFSILLQDRGVDTATCALLLGHTTTRYVDSTYKRHRPKDAASSISRLPAPEKTPYFLHLV